MSCSTKFAIYIFLTVALHFQQGRSQVEVFVDDVTHDSVRVYWNISSEETDIFIEETEVRIERLPDEVVTTRQVFIQENINSTLVEGLEERTNYIACVIVTLNVSKSAFALEEEGCSEEFKTLASLLWFSAMASASFLVLSLLCLGCIDLTLRSRKAAKERRKKENELLQKTDELS